MSAKSRYEKWNNKQRPEVRLKDFRLITHTEQIKETDFVCIIQTDFYEESTHDKEMGNRNILTYNGKKYDVSILKGMYRNFIKESKEMRMNTGKFADMEFCVYHVRDGSKYFEIFAYKTWQDMIRECSVYTYPEKVEILIDDKDIITHLDIKTSFEFCLVDNK